MYCRESGLSKYARTILNSPYPASNLLNAKDFLKYVGMRGFSLKIEDLEYFDMKGLLRPVLRLKRPKKDNYRYEFIETNFYALQSYLSTSLIEFPSDGDYQPWSSYFSETEESWLYYHPYQILQVDRISLSIYLKGSILEGVQNLSQYIESIRDNFSRTIEQKKNLLSKYWIPRVGLLMLLDDFYGSDTNLYIPHNIFDTSSRSEQIVKRKKWLTNFSANRVLLLSNMKVEQIEEFYKWLSVRALDIDPLCKWFTLQQIIKESRRYDLKNQALLAQEYYRYLFIIAKFIYDLQGKKLPDPDDVLDKDMGSWKERRYGKPYDIATKKTQNQILKYFLIDRPIELVIIVEGETEERVIELILQARGVDLEKDGFFVYDIQGQDNLRHLKPLFRVSQLIDIIIFAMLDNDVDVDKNINRMKKDASNLGYTKEILIRKWERDFESDNFGIELVMDKVNQILSEKGYIGVDGADIENRMKRTGEALITATIKTIGNNNPNKLKEDKIKASDILSKPYLAELLVRDRLKEIQIENNPSWDAKLPVEFELKEIFKLIPQRL